MKFILLASLLATASAIFEHNGGERTRGQRRQLTRSKKGGSSSSDEEVQEMCDTRTVLFFAERAIDEQYKRLSYDKDAKPQPLDTEVINVPMFDYQAYMQDGSKIIVGYIQETLNYVPFADFEDADCNGQAAWTFYNAAGEFTGQVTHSYTCFIGFDVTAITGGLGNYMCAEGYVKNTFKDENFFNGIGISTWDIVNCGKCDIPSMN